MGSAKAALGESRFEGARPLSRAEQAARGQLERAYAQRFLADEALRADLSDEEFKPLRDRALSAIHQKSLSVKDPSSEKAKGQMETLLAGLRAGIRGEETSRRGLELSMAERLLGDESLRHGVTSDRFQAFFDGAMAEVHRLAWTLPQPGSGDAQLALEGLYRSLVDRFRGGA